MRILQEEWLVSALAEKMPRVLVSFANTSNMCKFPFFARTVCRLKPKLMVMLPVSQLDSNICHIAVGEMGRLLEIVPPHLVDRRLVLKAVAADGCALMYASAYHDDDEIVYQAVQSNGRAIHFATARRRGDRQLRSLALVTYPEYILSLSPEEAREHAASCLRRSAALEVEDVERTMAQSLSKEQVCAAVEGNGLRLHEVQEAQRDYIVVLKAVKQNGMALRFAGHFRDHRFIVETAIHQNAMALQFATPRFRVMNSITQIVLQGSPCAALERYCSPEHVSRVGLVRVLSKGFAVPAGLHITKDVALDVVRQRGLSLEVLPFTYRSDPDVVIAAVKKDWRALEFAEVKTIAVVMAAVRASGMALRHAGYMRACREVVLAAVRRDGCALAYATERMQDDNTVVETAVRGEGCALRFASLRLRSDAGIVVTALRSCGLSIFFATSEFHRSLYYLLASSQIHNRVTSDALYWCAHEQRRHDELQVSGLASVARVLRNDARLVPTIESIVAGYTHPTSLIHARDEALYTKKSYHDAAKRVRISGLEFANFRTFQSERARAVSNVAEQSHCKGICAAETETLLSHLRAISAATPQKRERDVSRFEVLFQ